MLFPILGPSTFDEKDKSILTKMESFYAESVTINQTFWGEADTDTRFECGDQTLWNDIYGNTPANRRRQFNFNRIRPIINLISGYQRRNRMSTIVTAVENGDDITADQFTKILMWIHQQEGILETISESFHGSLVTGMNLLQVWVDYRTDPISGNIKVDNCPYNTFLIDPFFRKADLSDCNAIWKRSFLTKKQCLALLPDKEEDIAGLQGQDGNRDGKFHFMPETYNYGLKNLLTYDEFYYKDSRTQQMLVDSETGEVMEWPGKDEEKLKDYLKLYPQVSLIEQEVPTVNLAIVVGGRVMFHDRNPLGIDTYPFIPVFAYYNPQLPYFPWRIQGVVRGLRDAQYLYNRRRIIELDILESQISSGFIYKENALVNPKDIFQSGQGRGIALKEDAQPGDVVPIQAPQIPPSMIQLSELLGNELKNISGVNEELLGSAIDDKAGILSMLRQGAGLTTLQILFDNLDRAQKLLGKVMLDIIQSNFTPGKVKKILQGEEPSPQFYSKAFGKYDCVVEEGLNTTTQKQMNFAQLLQLREVGVQVPDSSLLDAATLQDKKKLIKAVEQAQQQQQQMQEAQVKSSLMEEQSRIHLAEARATADRGLGMERMSRIAENQEMAVERKAAAVRDEEEGLFNLVKALKEIETIDLAQVEKLINLASMVRQPMAAQEPETPKPTGV